MFLPSKLADAFEELQAAKKNRAPSDYVVATGFLYRVVGKRGHQNTAHAPKGADDDVVHGSVARRGFGGMRVTVCRVVSGGDRRNVRRRVVIRCSVHGFPMVCPSNRLQCFFGPGVVHRSQGGLFATPGKCRGKPKSPSVRLIWNPFFSRADSLSVGMISF